MRRVLPFSLVLGLLGIFAWLSWSSSRRSPAPLAREAVADAAPHKEVDPATLPLVPIDGVAARERVQPGRLAVAASAPAGADSAGAGLAPLPAVLRGRLIDEGTGEPVPDFALEVLPGDDARGEELVTDADGRFVTHARHLPGSFRFEFHEPSREDSDYEETELTLDTLDAEVELRLLVGPTYLIELRSASAAALKGLGARLSTEPGRRWARQAPATDLCRGTPSSSRLPWVRFHPQRVYGSRSRGPWTLALTSDGGLWEGAASVSSIVGRYPEVVALELTQRASLRGSVRDELGGFVEEAWMRLVRPKDGRRLEQWHLRGGHFRADALEPGRWELEIDSYEHRTYRTELVLTLGQQAVHDVVLVALEPAGGVSGSMTSASGTWHGEGTIALWGHAGTKSNRRVALDWSEVQGRWVSRFAFEDVPAGTYELEWLARDCPFEVLPAPKQLVTVPAHDLEILLQDDVPTAALLFRVRDATTGVELPTYDVWWRPAGLWANTHWNLRAGKVLVEDWPIGRAFTWVVRAADHALVSGNQHDLVREGAALVADVALPGGWGAQFFLRDADGHALEGVQLSFDGVASAPSGPEGRLTVALPARPSVIGVHTPSLGITGGDVDPLTGTVEDERWWAVGVVLE